MKKTDLLQLLDKIAPLSLAMEWDNCGMQTELGKTEINKVYAALEVTDQVIEHAAYLGCDMIITHHPLILPSFALTSLDVRKPLDRNITELIKRGMEVYSAHTCFDIAPGGNNDYLCSMLGIEKVSAICGGIARIGALKKAVRLSDFERSVFEKLGKPVGFLCGGDPARQIKTVALCTGGAGEYWPEALAAGADLYITGEIKHHEAAAIKQTGMAYIAAGHAGTEWIFVPNMAEQLRKGSLDALTVYEEKDHLIPFDRSY